MTAYFDTETGQTVEVLMPMEGTNASTMVQVTFPEHRIAPVGYYANWEMFHARFKPIAPTEGASCGG